MELARLNILVNAQKGIAESKKLQRELRKTGRAADTATGVARRGFRGLGREIFSLGNIITAAGITVFFKSLLTSAQALDRVKLGLETVTGSAEASIQELGFLRNTATELGLAFSSVERSYIGLAAAAKGTNLEGEETRRLFVAVSKASAALQLDAEQVKGSMLALQQIISKGKVSAEELRQQLGERLPGAFQIAARSMGITTAELDKLLVTGRLTAEDFLPAFAAELERTFSSGAVKGAQSLTAQINRLKNEFQLLKEALGGPGFKQAIEGTVSFFTQGLRVIRQNFGVIQATITGTFADITSGAKIAAAVIVGVFKGAAVVLDSVFRGISRRAIDAILSVTQRLDQAQSFLAGFFGVEVAQGLGKLNAALAESRAQTSSSKDVAGELLSIYSEMVGKVTEVANQHGAIKDAIAGQVDEFEEFRRAQEAAAEALKPGAPSAQGSLQTPDGAGKLKEEIEGVRGGIMRATEAMGTFQQRVADAVTFSAFAIEDGLTEGISSFIDGTKSAGEAFRDMASGIIQELIRITVRMLIVRSLMSAFGGAFGGGAQGATAAVSAAGGTPGFQSSRSTADFAAAPRFQTGGIAGDEVPAVLHRGETVFTPEQMSALGDAIAGSASRQPSARAVEVVNVTDPAEIDERIANNPELVLNVIRRNSRKVKQMIGG